MWPIDQVVVRDSRPIELGDLTSLKASIQRIGQLQPVAATEGDCRLIFGRRRLAAMKENGETEIAVSVIRDATDLDQLLMERDENTERLEKSPAARTALFEEILAIQKELTPTGAAAHKSDESSDLKPEQSRVKAAKAAGIGFDAARKVREIRETAEDTETELEVREEAQRQYEELRKPGAKVDPAHKAVKRQKEKAARKKELPPLGPGQWREPPKAKIEYTLTRRLVEAINKGQEIAKMATEIQDQTLDLDDRTLYVLRQRMREEVTARKQMDAALTEQIAKRGLNPRKSSP